MTWGCKKILTGEEVSNAVVETEGLWEDISMKTNGCDDFFTRKVLLEL